MPAWVSHAGWPTRLERVVVSPKIDSLTCMTLQEIEPEALALGESDRAALIRSLMKTLPLSGSEVGDDEAPRDGQWFPLSKPGFRRVFDAARLSDLF